MIEIKKIDNRPLNLFERIYIVEIFKGFLVTSRHFLANLFNPKNIVTIQYPETTRTLEDAANGRTRHRLKVRADGTPICVACFLCATACPAYCIHIESAEYPSNPVEKYPAVFDIDLARCVVCGMCVEACPEDAIAMDTEIIPGGALKREEMYLTKHELLKNLPGEPSLKGAANRLASSDL
jgi:NADH-quinone oxidoreductase subunit I